MLSPTRVDFSNTTQVTNFLSALLADASYQPLGNAAARRFWYGIVTVVGLIGIWNVFWRIHLRLRLGVLQQGQSGRRLPFAKLVAAIRQVAYLQLTPTSKPAWFKIPPLGASLVVIAYFVFIVLLTFVHADVTGPRLYTFIGVRAAWLTVAQIPLVVLLIGRNNLIGLITGISYERLNVYHRWVSRGLLLLATFHFAFLDGGWSRFPGLNALEWSTDDAPRRGIAAYAILLWMNLSTLATLRHLSYEFFLIQHILTYFGFIIAVMVHIPDSASYARVYVYVAIALYLTERLVFVIRYAFNNIHLSRASLEPLEGGATKIWISNRQINTWPSGAHVMLSIPRFGLIQSHPASIMSTPTSHNGDMVFVLRAYDGFTKRILMASQGGPVSTRSKKTSEDETEDKALDQLRSYRTLINGPYGGSSHGDFSSYDTVFLIAGATGVTFIMSILLDLAQRAASAAEGQGAPISVKKVAFVWIIRRAPWFDWASEELQTVAENFAKAGIEFTADVHITNSDSSYTSTPMTETVVNSPEIKPKNMNDTQTSLPLQDLGIEKPALQTIPGPRFRSGRPDWDNIFPDVLSHPEGEGVVSVCGPLSLSVTVRQKVVDMNKAKSGDHGIYLHVESFA